MIKRPFVALLLDLLDPNILGRQIYHGWDLASAQWAFGVLDEAGFRIRSLYGLYTVLLGIATKPVRPRIEAELRKLEKQLRAPVPGVSRPVYKEPSPWNAKNRSDSSRRS